MAGQIAGGFVLLSAHTLKGWQPGELALLRAELEKRLRDTRASVPAQDDALAQQARNHQMARLNSALQVVTARQSARH